MNKRPPSNQQNLQTLKDAGWKVYISHSRMAKEAEMCFCAPKNKSFRLIKDKLIKKINDDFYNSPMRPDTFYLVSPRGGATEIEFSRGEEKIVVRADVFHKDNFCRRTGVAVCLSKFEKIQKEEI